MRRDDVTDCTIWSQFKNGDKDAFAKLYELHSIDLLHYGSRICNDQEILKDTIQDLFVELWHSRENLSAVESVRFYLFRALRYKLVRAEKKRQQQNPLSIISSTHIFSRFELPVESTLIEKEALDSQLRVLRKAITSLSRRQQEAIQLRFYQGFTNEQIAELMNMNYQSVSNLLYNALCRIRKSIKTPVFASTLAAAFLSFFLV